MSDNEPGLLPKDLSRFGTLLEDLGAVFSDHGCNDFSLSNNDGNRVVLKTALDWVAEQSWGDPEWREIYSQDDQDSKSLDFYDHWLLSYFGERCQEAAKPQGKPLSPMELEVIAELVDHALDVRDAYDDHGEDYTLPATPENQSFFTDVVRHHGGDEGAEKLREIEASEDEITVSDSWIMAYYADRCRDRNGDRPRFSLRENRFVKAGGGNGLGLGDSLPPH